MASKRVTIAAAVVTALSGGTFAQAFTAGRKYVPLLPLDALGLAGFLATVWIGDERRQVYSRAQTRKDLDIHIGLEARIQPSTKPESVAAADVAELDGLMEVAEQVADFLEPLGKASPNLGTTGATWTKTVVNGPYSPQSLREERVFASGLVITYAYL
jgi:hypothetical protein